MRVLVTGARGYLGSALRARMQVAGGYGVVPAGRGTDLTGLGAFDAIVHLAGGGGPAACDRDPIKAVRDLVLATTALDAVIAPRRLIASSLYVYPPCDRACRETDPTGPETLYGACKEAAEAAWSGTALRFAHIYGPSPKPHDDVVSKFARAAVQGTAATIHGAGRRRMDLLHIDDACTAILAALHAKVLPPVINIGGESPVSVREIADLAGAKTQHGDGDAADTPDRWLDCTLAREALGWVPRVGPATGIATFVASMREAS